MATVLIPLVKVYKKDLKVSPVYKLKDLGFTDIAQDSEGFWSAILPKGWRLERSGNTFEIYGTDGNSVAIGVIHEGNSEKSWIDFY